VAGNFLSGATKSHQKMRFPADQYPAGNLNCGASLIYGHFEMQNGKQQQNLLRLLIIEQKELVPGMNNAKKIGIR
jgi:hypothetical protein